MSLFPTHKFSITSRETVRDPVLLSTARSGAPKTRRLYSRPRRAFNLVLRGLTNAEKAMVEIFLAANRMTAFQIEWCGVPTYGGVVRLPTSTEHFNFPLDMLPLAGDYTIEASVYVESFNPWWHAIYGGFDWGVSMSPFLNWAGELDITEIGLLYFNRGAYGAANTPGFYKDFWGNKPLRLRAWTHVAVTFDYATQGAELFQNAKPDGATSFVNTGVVDAVGAKFLCGGWGSVVRDSPIMVDELRFWNVKRTQAELAANMNAAMTGTEPGLIACYHFDGSAVDATPNARDLVFDINAAFDDPELVPGKPAQWLNAGPVGYKPDTVFSVIEETGERAWAKDDGAWSVDIPVLEA